MDVKALIKACIKQDRAGQKMLYDSYSKSMYAVCLRYMQDDFCAQDALQRGFIKVFDKIHEFRHQGALGGWIRRIIVTTCLEDLRRQKNDKLFFPENELPDLPDAEFEFDEENYEKMLAIIRSLPGGYQYVFSMYVIDEMSHSEIAKALNIKESTSRTQLMKARKCLQKLLIKQNILP